MKSKYILYLTGSALFAIMLFTYGCKVDLAEPEWTKDYTEPAEPVITEIIPANEAAAGVNTITINGQNFAPASGTNFIYFNNVIADIISASTSSITIRRPNIAADDCVVKVVPSTALVVAKLEPYKVTQVFERYGEFRDNLELSTVAADAEGNIYVIETSSRDIIKFSVDGVTSTIGTASRPAYDAVIRDGKMYVAENNRAIDVVDLQSGEVSRWLRLPSGRVVHHGAFDDLGYYYCGGRRSRLVIIPPDANEDGITDTDDMYRQDEIMGVRTYNGYVYLLVLAGDPDDSTPEWAIWKNQIMGDGTVGDKELVLDLAEYAPTDSTMLGITSFNISSDGRIFLSVNSDDPMMVYDLAAQKMDYFYKGILPTNCKYFNWGSGTYIYMINGDTDLGVEWTIYRADMGVPGS